MPEQPPGSPSGAEPLDKTIEAKERICIFADCLAHKLNLSTVRKRGTTGTIKGEKRQVWQCRECRRNWQTDENGNVVKNNRNKGRFEE
ncbi:MAG: hypothetical protein PHX61_02440 [Alphaproteobacteria bacterium]|nr:hypothetical protein [Alphaproteobacteria bacterium]